MNHLRLPAIICILTAGASALLPTEITQHIPLFDQSVTMTSRLGLGVPMSILAPATAAWAAPFVGYYLFLQGRVTFQRFNTHTNLGHSSKDASNPNADPLYLANRAQVNFNENVPIALVAALLAELNGANRTFIHYALGSLMVFRIAHAEFGLMYNDGKGAGRAVGFFGTGSVLAGFAGYLGYLVKDYVMG